MVRGAFAQQSVTGYLKMLRDAPMSGLVKLRCSVATGCGCPLWAVDVDLASPCVKGRYRNIDGAAMAAAPKRSGASMAGRAYVRRHCYREVQKHTTCTQRSRRI